MNRLDVISSIPKWYLTQFDYNKDISEKESPVPIITSYSLRIQLEYLGAVFQIYPKGLPEIGDCTRIEGQYSTTEKEKAVVVDIVTDIIDGKLPFITAEDMLLKSREKLDDDSNFK